MYNVDYFIKKFEAIPEELWTEGHFEMLGSYCAMGHCGQRDFGFTEEILAITSLLHRYLDSAVTKINDGWNIKYQQPTPKQRILAALYDVKKMEQPQYDNITKEIAALPIQQEVSDVNKISWLL